MKVLYLDLSMGAAGDMLAAALSGLLGDDDVLLGELTKMSIPSVTYSLSPSVRGGISGHHFSVAINGEEEGEHTHHGHSMHDIEHIVENLNTSDEVKRDILGVYNIIAEAESKVHGCNVREVHFHEVGMLDAVADIAAVCTCIRKLAPDKIFASPVHVGSGTVRCAHGILPVPAPATSEILSGIPMYGGEISGELCTPTGAALLKYFVSEFGNMPTVSVERIGYGMGKKEFERPNCIRAFLGTADKSSDVTEISANIDDMTGEDIAFATEKILGAGALDVWTESIMMKKSRPGVKLCVLCESAQTEEFSELILRYTTTIGVRYASCGRYTLSRREECVDTKLGSVRKKVSSGKGIEKEKFEFSDLAKIAEENGMTISEVRKIISAE